MSPAPATTRNRRAVKAEEVAQHIRGLIVRGEWEPGFRLPSWNELGSQYDVARSTLTEAMRQLKGSGFVYSQSTRGTFVSSRPPHLSRYALAFRGEPGTPGWNRFWWSLSNEAAERYRDGDVSLASFFGVAGTDRSSGHERLLRHVATDRLAGVIFVGHPPEISDQLLNHPWLAKVVIGAEHGGRDDIPRVYPDRQSFVKRSLEHLAERGCRRLAVVTNGLPEFERYDALAPDYGLTLPSHFRVGALMNDPASAKHVVQLLLDRPSNDRPDALIVTDDNLVESALSGVMAAGLRMPDPLRVVTHCNWPLESAGSMPVARLGFDTRDVLRLAIERVDALRHGRAQEADSSLHATTGKAGDVPVPAVFEHEVAPRLAIPMSPSDF